MLLARTCQLYTWRSFFLNSVCTQDISCNTDIKPINQTFFFDFCSVHPNVKKEGNTAKLLVFIIIFQHFTYNLVYCNCQQKSSFWYYWILVNYTKVFVIGIIIFSTIKFFIVSMSCRFLRQVFITPTI